MTAPKSSNTTLFCSDCAEDSNINCAAIRDYPEPEFIDPVFAITSSKGLFSMTENERFGLVFAKTAWVYKFGHRNCRIAGCREDTQRQMLLCKQSTCDQSMTWQGERNILLKIKRTRWRSQESAFSAVSALSTFSALWRTCEPRSWLSKLKWRHDTPGEQIGPGRPIASGQERLNLTGRPWQQKRGLLIDHA